ncbi:MAG: hypothetical protein IPO88_12450 [Nannocystis sp.]|uniref:hypothetical protein n=1 Tax=Nannocystis sp. TaxID=1962667 RepID=UPI00242630C3|nr:hypothetical protein [Nannocystis sp.]MBK9754294.1 hypothetical protein [Nannocystis sp.]
MHPSLRSRTRSVPVPGLVHFAGLVGVTGLALGLLACSEPTPQAPPPAENTAPTTDKNPLAGLSSLLPGQAPEAWKFEFKDPGPGPRAPVTVAFEATIGSSMFPEIESLVYKRNLKCADTSIRAMMDKRRESEKARIADAKARGEDAVTAASWVNKRSKREANPQLRFSCPKVSSDQLGDRARTPSTGRLLYVFDDASYPLRHASYQRTHKDQALALKDFEETSANFTRLYGPPTKTFKAELPKPDKDGKVEFPGAINYESSWEFADLLARVNILRYGDLVTIGERVEVPHGLRPDAPRFVDGKVAPPTPTPASAAGPSDAAAPSDATAPPAAAPPAPAPAPEPTSKP